MLRNIIDYQVKRVDWLVLNYISGLKQNFFSALAEQMKHDFVEFVLYEQFLMALQDRCTTWQRAKNYRFSVPLYLVNLIKQRRYVLYLDCLIRSEDLRILCLVRTRKRASLLEPLQKKTPAQNHEAFS
jgi:hypothetical protein